MIAFAINIIVMIVIIRSNNFIPYLQFSAPAIESRIIGTSYYFPVTVVFYPMLQYFTNIITRLCFFSVISNQFKTTDNLEFLTNFCLANKHCLFIDTLPRLFYFQRRITMRTNSTFTFYKFWSEALAALHTDNT